MLGVVVSVSAQEVPVRTAEEAFRLGGISAPEYASWTYEPGIVAATDGTIFVRSRQPPAIAVFGPEGEFVRSFLGEGEGPGEFRSAAGHGLLGDTLWVTNFPAPRVSLFSVDGSHLETMRMEPIDFGRPLSAPGSVSALLEGGNAIAVSRAVPIGASEPVAVPVLVGRRSMAEPSRVFDVTLPTGMLIPGVGAFAAVRPYTASPLVAIASDGSGFLSASWDDGDPGRLELTKYSPEGAPTWSRSLTYQPVRISDDEREAWVDAGVEASSQHIEAARSRGRVPSGSARELVTSALYLPEFVPPVTAVVLGHDGTVWLQTERRDDASVWLVLDEGGDPVFRVQLPAGLTVRDASVGVVWGTESDQLDVPFVVRLNIR